MIRHSLFKVSKKYYDFVLMALITLMYVTICAEADMYVPAFPQMIDYFGVNENQIQLVLSLNFIGLCISGLIAGPLSDCYGRRVTLLGGLLLLVISSLGCVLATSFEAMLIWRILQGAAASFPMVVSAAAFFDKYSAEKAGQMIGAVNSVITASMAGAPIIGAIVSDLLGWRMNFTIIFILSVVTFVGSWLLLDETLNLNKRKEFALSSMAVDYMKLIKSFKFVGYSIIACFSLIVILMYISNLSVIFISHLGMPLEVFGYYQATAMGTFVLFSLLSVKLIASKGIDFTKKLGGSIAFLGSVGIFIVGMVNPQSVNLICLSMAILAAGGAMMVGTFGVNAMSVHPEMTGTSLAMLTAIRQGLVVLTVSLSEIMFDGTITPVAIIIFGYAVISLLIYIIISCRSNKMA